MSAVRLRMCSHLMRGIFGFDVNPSTISITQRYPKRLFSSPAAECDTKSERDSTSATKDGTNKAEDNALSKAEQAFKEEKEKLTKQLTDIEDKYKRSLAETENVRQRLRKQIDDAKLFGIQGFCKDLLEVADILGKATETTPKEQLNDDNPHLKSLYEGLTLTENQLQKVFTKNGLLQIYPSEGEKFDPNVHEALFQAPPMEGKEPGTVATVTKVGYSLHNRTLRPALVGVFKDG